jgi:hypothetical protein
MSRWHFIWDPVEQEVVAAWAYRKRQARRAEGKRFTIAVPPDVERGRFAFRDGKWVNVSHEPRPLERGAGLQIIRDIDPYRSVLTREVVGGRRQHRDHLRAHGCIELGTELPRPRRTPLDRQGLHDDLMRAWEEGMTPEAQAALLRANMALPR